MLPTIKCTIIENEKLVESLTQITDFQHLSESLDKFELELNAAITKLIKDTAELSGDDNLDDENDDTDGEDEDEQSPKKKKKN